jgi:hypothetical protein
VSGSSIVLAVGYALFLALIAYSYGRQRRWAGLFGWALLMGGLLLVFGGAGDDIAWGGLLWSFIAAFGALLVLMDVVGLMLRRRRG